MPLNLGRPWWEIDSYTVEEAIPECFEQLAGPNQYALVRAYESGQTQKGWGLAQRTEGGEIVEPGFMERYDGGEFLPRRALYGYEKGKNAFAFVMRSVRILCVDIDGKNGGLEFAPTLGNLPETLAETSKSGTGYHLFYEVDDAWSPDEGFGVLPDAIGLVQGVDIRYVGCVYHWASQRWNDRPLAKLPEWFYKRLMDRKEQQAARAAEVKGIALSGDPDELLLMQAEVEGELRQKMPPGKRNNTLFAVGHKMRVLGVDDWEAKVSARAVEVGLPSDEIDNLIRNIGRYNA